MPHSRNTYSMPIDEMESRSAADGRYRTLLEVPGAIATQPDWKAALQSLRRLLSSVVAFDSVGLLLLSDNGNSLRLTAFDRDPEADEFEIGTQVPHAGTAVGRAIDEQKPIYVPDVKTELSMIPQLAARKPGLVPRIAPTYFLSQYPGRNSGL